MQETNRFGLFTVLLLTLLSLISCTARQNSTEPTSSLINPPLSQITPTDLNLLISTDIPPTIIAPPTISGISTLAPEKAYLELEDLFKNDCGLPCFAEITPGETLLIDASKTLLPFSGISNWNSLSESGGQLSIDYPKEDLIFILSFQVQSPKNEKHVQLLNVFTEALQEVGERSYQWVYDAKPYHEVFGVYSLQNVLATYGKPSEIYVTVEINEGEQTSPDFFSLWLMYPKKGFIAKYITNADETDDIVYGCPSKTFVELWLFSPYSDEKYKEDLLSYDMELGYIFPEPSSRTKSISDGIGITIDEFYQIFSHPTNQCLETPSSNWPNWWR